MTNESNPDLAEASIPKTSPAPMPTEKDVSSVIAALDSVAQSVLENQVQLQAVQMRLAAAEMRAQSAEQLLRRLYSAAVNHLGGASSHLPQLGSAETTYQNSTAHIAA